MHAHGIGNVLADAGFGHFHHFAFQRTHFLAFGFALLVGQGGVGHGSVDVFHLAVQFVELGSDSLVDIVVGGTGGGAALSVEFDIDFSVFEEEVHNHTLCSGGAISKVAVGGSVLRSFEGEGSVGDDCGIEFYELAAFYGLQKDGIAVGCTLYRSGYGVTLVPAVTGCEYGSGSEQVS